jgi:hypothetical protein
MVPKPPKLRQQLFPLLILWACAAAVCLPRHAAARQGQAEDSRRRGAVDWIFVLDTSASMRGAGGAKNIFDRVKASLADFIRSTREGDSVTLYTFDRDVVTRPTVRISDETDKRDLLNALGGLRADGERTYTGKAIHDALLRAGELKQRSESAHRVASIVLLTDGIEDVRGIPNPVSIPSNVTLIPNSQPYIFFVSLGEEHEQQLEDFVKNPALNGRGRVVRDVGAQNIENLADSIREQVEEAEPTPTPTPAPTPTPINITVEPASLDFGRVEPGGQTGRETLGLLSNADAAVRLSLEGASGGLSLAEPTGPVSLKAGERRQISVRLAAAPNAADGARTLLLKVNVSDEAGRAPEAVVKASWAEARVTVEYVPLWSKLLKWLLRSLAVLLLALLLAVFIYSLYKGDTPWGLWEEFRRRKYLEGELELIRPAPARDEDALINLGKLASKRAALSSLVPDGATAGSDAELTTAFRHGVKLIQLRSTSGEVRVNDTQVAYADLYDQDVVELGEARLRFNWLGHERPVTSEEELS